MVARIRDEVAQGRQVYWVCPLIEESEALDLRNATADACRAQRRAARLHASALLHGRMKAAEKAAVMAQFSAGQMQVLVATTVIEVGVDVPNASLMVVEHAERFGLASCTSCAAASAAARRPACACCSTRRRWARPARRG